LLEENVRLRKSKANEMESTQKEQEKKLENSETVEAVPASGIRTVIKTVIAIMSGKGGVGKSAVTMLLASALRRKGFEVGILDADITGPSIPRGLGVDGPIFIGKEGPVPAASPGGIKVMSMNLLLPDEDEAVIWRGPLISGAVKQFYEETEWGDLDYLLLDLPPGTADVPLTVMQSIPLDGIVLVTSPQELAGMIVGKARKMADALEAQVIGLVENMSHLACPHCGEKIEPFGESSSERASTAMGVPFLGRLPLDPEISKLADAGRLEEYRSPDVDALLAALLEHIVSRDEMAVPADGTAKVERGNMKIAIVMEGNDVSPHFGHCEKVMLVTIEDGKVNSREVLDAPEHDCGALPRLFSERQVEYVIAGGLGGGAMANLNRAGVKVLAGVQGSAEDALGQFLAGTIVGGDAVCGGGQGICGHGEGH
jgi:Mrp family chromosome partitioning ATPase/predicted Fe-Mo cluster-binding NifX family protein